MGAERVCLTMTLICRRIAVVHLRWSQRSAGDNTLRIFSHSLAVREGEGVETASTAAGGGGGNAAAGPDGSSRPGGGGASHGTRAPSPRRAHRPVPHRQARADRASRPRQKFLDRCLSSSLFRQPAYSRSDASLPVRHGPGQGVTSYVLNLWACEA